MGHVFVHLLIKTLNHGRPTAGMHPKTTTIRGFYGMLWKKYQNGFKLRGVRWMYPDPNVLLWEIPI